LPAIQALARILVLNVARYISPEKKSGRAVPKPCASTWLSDTWNAHQ